MSLTSHLATKESPVGKYIRKCVPAFEALELESPFRKAALKFLGLDQLPKTILPTLAPKSNQAVIGVAIDYRIRLYFKGFSVSETSAGYAIRNSTSKAAHDLVEKVIEFISRVSPSRGLLGNDHEEEINTYCIALAWFEMAARSGGFFPDGVSEIANAGTVSDLLARVRAEDIADLNQLSKYFFLDAGQLTKMPVTLNPKFAGSENIGGADGDLLLGPSLIDLKAIAKLEPYKVKRYIAQLIGYVLLDFENEFDIKNIALILLRQRQQLFFPIWQLLLPVPTVVKSLMSGESNFLIPEADDLLRIHRKVLKDLVERYGQDF